MTGPSAVPYTATEIFVVERGTVVTDKSVYRDVIYSIVVPAFGSVSNLVRDSSAGIGFDDAWDRLRRRYAVSNRKSFSI